MIDARVGEEAETCGNVSGVLRQSLHVTRVQDGVVSLEGHRGSACAQCAAKTGCGAGALAELLSDRQTLQLPQTFSVAEGDTVVLAMDRRAFLAAALRAYLIPPAALVVTAGAAQVFDMSNLLTVLLCLLAFILSFLPLLRADRRGLCRNSLWLEKAAAS